MDTARTYILVVDDLIDAADTTLELLSVWGYDGIACYDGALALASARIRPPDAVILDLVMPRMDGFRFAELFRELPCCKSVPLIAVSGYSSSASPARARKAGIPYYLLKPVAPTMLKELVAHVVKPKTITGAAVRSEQLGAGHFSQLRVGGRSPMCFPARGGRAGSRLAIRGAGRGQDYSEPDRLV